MPLGLRALGAYMLLFTTVGASLYAISADVGASWAADALALLARMVAGLGGEGFVVFLQAAITGHYGRTEHEVLSMSVVRQPVLIARPWALAWPFAC